MISGQFLNLFTTLLLVFSGIVLLVATFSIYNTFAIVIAQRTRENALLRALGASRRQVVALDARRGEPSSASSRPPPGCSAASGSPPDSGRSSRPSDSPSPRAPW